MKVINKKHILFCLFIMQIIPLISWGQEKKLPPANLKKDVKFYFNTIKNTHPQPDAFVEFSVIDATEQKIINDITKPMYLFDFAKKIEFETNSLFDNHTKMHYIFDAPEYLNFEDTLFFPLSVSVVDDNLFSNENFEKIISINGHSVNEILTDFRKIFSADISIKHQNKLIKTNFPLYYSLIYNEYEKFDIEIIDKEDQIIKKSLKGTSIKQVKSYIENNKYKSNNKNFDFTIYQDTIALLTINTFENLPDNQYITFLDTAFLQLKEKECKYLFIDIRNNFGGSTKNANILLDYLLPNDYKIFSSIGLKRMSKAYKKEYGKDGNIFFDGKNKINFEYGYVERENKTENYFNGKIFVLQSFNTTSAALDFVSMINMSNRGVTVGEPTGEPARSFSQAIVFQLPHSKLYFQCATGLFLVPYTATNDLWLQPNIPFEFTEQEISMETLKNIILIERKFF